MATVPDPDEVLCSTKGKENFQRVTRLLISGGTILLRQIFDVICPPSHLPTILKSPTTEKQLRTAKLTKPQWDCLYPSPGVYGTSTDFDVTLLFRLLRTICNLIPPATGWDALPTSTDHSLAADLVRIKYYRNSVYGHVNQQMEITDDEFLSLWKEISETLVRIAGQISPTEQNQWQKATEKFLKEPLTVEDERNVHELQRWYENDTEVKQSIEKLKNSTEKGIERLETSLKDVQGTLERALNVMEGKSQNLEGAIQLGSQLFKHVGGEFKSAVCEDTQDIKQKLGEVMGQAHRDRLSTRSSQVPGGQLIITSLLVECLTMLFKRFSFIVVLTCLTVILPKTRGPNQMILLLDNCLVSQA